MSIVRALQKAIKETIDGASLGVPFYDGAPTNTAPPFIEFGPIFTLPDDADCILGREVTVQIDVWRRDQGKLHLTSLLVDQVYSAIHEAQLSLDNPYACVNCRVTLTRVFPDPDGITAHGILQVTVLAEDRT